MTIAWRICRSPFADLSGEGARLFGGRWNSRGRPVVYAAETAALAVLEVRVHLDLDWDLLPDDYVLMSVDLGSLVAEEIVALPDDPRAVGDAWLRAGRSALLRVPSAIVPESFNILINPLHPDAAAITRRVIRSFVFDPRLWTRSSSALLPRAGEGRYSAADPLIFLSLLPSVRSRSALSLMKPAASRWS